jgi:hypothetical protein
MAVVEQKDIAVVQADRVTWPSPSPAEPSAAPTRRDLEPRSPGVLTRALLASLRWGMLAIPVCAVAVIIFLLVGSFLEGA